MTQKPTPEVTRKWGAKRDVSDLRDRPFTARLGHVPDVVSTRTFCGPMKDQLDEGSCTGHAGSSFVEWVNRKYLHRSPVLSPQDLYVNELVEEGTFPNDEGAMPRTICKILTSLGVCEESVYKYTPHKRVLPTEAQKQNALRYKQGAYHRMNGARDFISCLGDATPWPVLVAFSVYQSFETDQVAKTGVMPIPQFGEPLLGGHEVLGVGYDIGVVRTIRPEGCPPAALIQNSWGNSWGDQGFFWMPLAVLDSPDSDLWMVHPGKAW